ncbi:MAG: type II toxin-antitoxin system RelE/ParE family toxin [Clostridia bacterium]|nr:type II toxin-antitoxin system RelE/ParE family toxin [Clostridia bacterium]
MKIKYGKKALRFLSKVEASLVQNVRKAINGLTETPPKGDIKPLEGFKDGRKRLRLGKYRIIFRYDDVANGEKAITVLFIMNIGSRGDIYKEG